jgi:hypothetical protein
MDELIQRLDQVGLIENEEIILDDNQRVPVSTFRIFFGDKEPTYENLSGYHTFAWGEETITRTAEDLGYKVYFDQWRGLDII